MRSSLLGVKSDQFFFLVSIFLNLITTIGHGEAQLGVRDRIILLIGDLRPALCSPRSLST
ncbi:MAG: hypothetical protein A2Y65_11230 [Deltaproteobacteria bacterium RBG_13_52_11]|nr:MAG: hypothetical protein A2Y65_11230 [Deltaproteobacteria bacterium RBG_13_52_11]